MGVREGGLLEPSLDLPLLSCLKKLPHLFRRRFSIMYCFLPQINDIVGEFEQEKFEMQKHHTKSIQEILDDTNARLQKMEKEYSQQTLSTVRDMTKY